jgi:hypothetical protein
MRLDSSGKLRIGTTSGTGPVLTGGLTTTSTETELFIGRSGAVENSSVGDGASIQLQNATNTTACIIQQYSNNLQFFNYTGTVWTERARITSGGDFLVKKTTLSNTARGVYIYADDGAGSRVVSSGNNTTGATLFAGTREDTGTFVFQVLGNGNVQNTNNSYGAISDLKLKENITDATPKLDDLLQVRVVNYNLKTLPNQKHIGVIAQELEQVFPSMIEESFDRDVETEELTGETTKAVKYSVFVPILIKAIQEQQTIINDLRSRVATLENN